MDKIFSFYLTNASTFSVALILFCLESPFAPSLINHFHCHVALLSVFFPPHYCNFNLHVLNQVVHSHSVFTCFSVLFITVNHSHFEILSSVFWYHALPLPHWLFFLRFFSLTSHSAQPLNIKVPRVLSWVHVSSPPTHSSYVVSSSLTVFVAIYKQMTPKFVFLTMTSTCKF